MNKLQFSGWFDLYAKPVPLYHKGSTRISTSSSRLVSSAVLFLTAMVLILYYRAKFGSSLFLPRGEESGSISLLEDQTSSMTESTDGPYDIFKGSIRDVRLVLTQAKNKQQKERTFFDIKTRQASEATMSQHLEVEALLQQHKFTTYFNDIKRFLKFRKTVIHVPFKAQKMTPGLNASLLNTEFEQTEQAIDSLIFDLQPCSMEDLENMDKLCFRYEDYDDIDQAVTWNVDGKYSQVLIDDNVFVGGDYFNGEWKGQKTYTKFDILLDGKELEKEAHLRAKAFVEQLSSNATGEIEQFLNHNCSFVFQKEQHTVRRAKLQMSVNETDQYARQLYQSYVKYMFMASRNESGWDSVDYFSNYQVFKQRLFQQMASAQKDSLDFANCFLYQTLQEDSNLYRTKIMEDLTMCPLVKFIKEKSLTRTGFYDIGYETDPSTISTHAIFQFKDLFVNELNNLVMEVRKSITENLFDSVLVDIGSLDSAGNSIHVRAAQDNLQFDCIEDYLELSTRLSRVHDPKTLRDMKHFDKVCSTQERMLQFGHTSAGHLQYMGSSQMGESTSLWAYVSRQIQTIDITEMIDFHKDTLGSVYSLTFEYLPFVNQNTYDLHGDSAAFIGMLSSHPPVKSDAGFTQRLENMIVFFALAGGVFLLFRAIGSLVHALISSESEILAELASEQESSLKSEPETLELVKRSLEVSEIVRIVSPAGPLRRADSVEMSNCSMMKMVDEAIE